ncbi:RNA 2',3'-cyclic phosphodiesterase [soil metagenome]
MKKRIFIAVDISDEAKQKVAEYIANLKKKFSDLKVGWDRPEKLHLTLKFLGDTEENQLEKLEEICETISSEISNLKFQISNTGVFPSPQNARVLWLGVGGDVEELQKINSVLEDECGKFGFKKENRIYKPHLTIARLREPHKSKELVKTHLENKFEPVAFEVSEIVIYESKLQPTGSIYSKVQSSKFKVQS